MCLNLVQEMDKNLKLTTLCLIFFNRHQIKFNFLLEIQTGERKIFNHKYKNKQHLI